MKTMITGMLILMLGGVGLTQAVSLDYISIPSALDSVSAKQFAKMNGISEIVYDCATDVLAGKDAEGLIEFIQNDAVNAGLGDFSPTASALRECVYLDPLGWHGTDNEWAIELLNTDEWER